MGLKIAIITTHAGTPGTLASTAFIGALADGFVRLGIPTRIIGLALGTGGWQPHFLEPFDTAVPWLSPSRPRMSDRLAAIDLGISQKLDLDAGTGIFKTRGWYFELLLQRELRNFAGEDGNLTIMMYSRSAPSLITVMRIARREGWKVIAFATEALSNNQIDPATRDTYIHCVSKGCDGILAVSSYLASFWKDQGVAEERLLVTPTAIRESSFITAPSPRTSSAMYIGNLSHREIVYLIDICADIKQRIPGFHLTIFGDATGDQRTDLQKVIIARGLVGTVSIEAPVRSVDLPPILIGADVLILPRARGEFSDAGFPNKLGDYLATGRPVITTNVGDIPRYLVDKESAFLVEPDNCDAFVETLYHVLSNKELADSVGLGGRIVAQRLFDSASVAKQIVAFIVGIPTRAPGGSASLVTSRCDFVKRFIRSLRLSPRGEGSLTDRTWRRRIKMSIMSLVHVLPVRVR